MKEHNRKSIRWELEQLNSKKSQIKMADKKPRHTPKGLNMHWKDVVIFCFALVFTTMYQINAYAGDVDFDEISSGMFMSFDDQTGEYTALRLSSAEYNVDVFGMLATVSIKQNFINQSGNWVKEGVYAFPMADKSAVYKMKLIIGQRVIEGEIHEKQQAEQIYQQAKAAGQTASIVKQYRPNLFSTDIANIAPGEMLSVEITYQQTLRYDAGHFDLRIPLALKARYVPDQFHATLPVNKNVDNAYTRSIKINLDAGFELDEISSLYHNVDISQDFQTHQISLLDSQLYDANDFVLRWYPKTGHAPIAALFSEVREGFEYSLLMVLPPNTSQKITQKRNITFIIDTSGSMHGVALDQAKDALLYALSELASDSYFNVIDFDSIAKTLFDASRPANVENINMALDFISGLSSDGGTNMAPALQIAMHNKNIKTDRLNQIIFITDGSVGNEATIFEQIARDIGSARLFTVAIGPAPNNYFMSKAALFGKGSYTHIADLKDVDQSMSELFDKLASPAMTDIVVDWQSSSVEQSPSIIPDLYAGEPIVVAAKAPVANSSLRPELIVSGITQNKNWSDSLRLNKDGQSAGISRLWARNKVGELSDDMMLGGDYEVLKNQIIDLALKHHLVSEFTALVAVDKNPDASRIARAKAAHQSPYPQTALAWKWQMLIGMMLLFIAFLGRKLTSVLSR
ncbi:MAG: VWA domain-containing protein [Proteobacteria bacterium]|nr:VWA domain-containing protein [Pseudomonadota bacterium]